MKRVLVVLMLLFLVGCGNSDKITVDNNFSVKVGEEKKLLPKTDSDKKILFESLDDNIATVSEDGLVKGIKEGETRIIVSLKEAGPKARVEVTVTVLKPDLVVSLTVDVANQIKLGEEVTAIATTNDPEGVTFASSDESIFTVSNDGKITTLKVGSANLIVKSKSDSKVEKVVSIEVREKIVISASDINLAKGLTVPIGITHNDPLGVTYETIGEAIEIDGENVIGLAEGTATIKITSKTEPDYSITINVNVSYEFINVLLEEHHKQVDDIFEIEIDSTGGYNVLIEDETVVSLTEEGFKALKPGVTNITFSLKSYPTFKTLVVVNVYPNITLEVVENIDLKIQEVKEVTYTSNEELILSSSDDKIFTVSENNITGVKGGTAQLIFKSAANPAFTHEVTVTVAPMPTRLIITAARSIVLSEETQIVNNFTPVGSFSYVTYKSSDENILTVNEDGVVKGIGIGSATVTVTSTFEPLLNARITITVERINAVKQGITDGETAVANGYLFTEGVNLFKTLEEALVGNPKEVILIGTFENPITISNDVILSGTPETVIKNVLTINSDDVTINGMTFIDAGRVVVNSGFANAKVTNSTFKDISYTSAPIHSDAQNGLEVSYNNLTLNNQVGINIVNPSANEFVIKGNNITGALTAVLVKAEVAYNQNLSLQVMWNKVSNVETAFDINLSYAETFYHSTSYVRFNEATEYSFGAKAQAVNLVDFNLNYWGGEPDYAKFVNLGSDDLDGYYLDTKDIIDESLYNPNGPAYLKILNDLTEINIKDTVTVEYKVLPKNISTNAVRLITSNPEIMVVGAGNKLIFKRSGFVELILRSSFSEKINDAIRFEVITDPGIEIIPENNKNNLVVGQELKINAMVFPSKISDTPVKFSVDKESLATISQQGVLIAKAPGLVTVKVELHNDQTVFQIFRVEIYDSLDMNNIMDLISASIITYTPMRTILMYGAGNYWYTSYESVSRLIFEEISRNKTLMMPECDSLTDAKQKENCKLLRPGARSSMLEGLETFNDKRVYYITVHETANTSPNQGAYSHARYLLNQINGSIALRQASWHFTMDDKELYQHLPTDEMAWHAGDGTRKAGTTYKDQWGGTRLGGGNAHSIGIETSVAQGDDIFKIWHRTAKLSAELSREYNLPHGQVKFHQDFASKWCPQSMLRAELSWLFYEMVDFEYRMENYFTDAVVEFTSHNPEYVSNDGRVIKIPDNAQNVSFTIKVTYKGVTVEKTFYSYLPGTIH